MPLHGRRQKPLPDRLDGSSISSNWSGYALTGSSFTSVQGSWVVPTADCKGVKGNQYAAFWVGIDGYASNTVEQAGTLSDCSGKSASYFAWYEFYPQGMVEITSVPIQPGDRMSASVAYDGTQFTATVTDESTGASFSASAIVPGARRSSAEWIGEAPCCTTNAGILPMTDFKTVTFGTDSTGVSATNYAANSSNRGAIGDFPTASVVQINKVSSSTSPQTSTCSALSTDGTSFSCNWEP